MFLRLHHIGESTYCEVLESYRDPATGKPRHRLVVRWAAQYGRDVRQQHFRAKLLTASRQGRSPSGGARPR